MVACDTPQKRALRELSEAGIEVSARSLVTVVGEGDARNTARLISAGVHLEQRDAAGRTPLRVAVENREVGIALSLLEAGANVEATAADGVSVLGMAIFQNEPVVAETLIAAGARADGRMPDGEVILPWAIHHGRLSFVRAMMRAGADPHLIDAAGNPLLHIAMNAGRRDITESLLELGADPGATNPAGETTLHLALRHGWHDILPQLTAAGADPNLAGPSGRMPLEEAIEARDAELLDFLLRANADANHRNPAGVAPLHAALDAKWSEGLAVLARRGADFGVPNASGVSGLERVFESGDQELLALLLQYTTGTAGHRLGNWLWQAFEHNDPALGRLLLANGARATRRNAHGRLPVEAAVAAGRGDWVKLLLDFGAPVGRSLHDACARGDGRMAGLLLAMGVHPDEVPIPFADSALATALRNRQDQAACLLIHHGARLDQRLPEGQELLHLAIATGCHGAVRQLLDAGADANAPLTLPADPEFMKHVRPGIMRWALKSERNVTPLMLAADSGVYQSAAHLLQAGAKTVVWTRNSRMWPVNFASRRSDVKMMRVILGQDAEVEQRQIVVSLSKQSARLLDQSGNEIFTTKVSTGKRGHATPTGEFVITNKHRHWTSTIYHASMPYFQRLSCSAIGLHQGVVPGYPASHGCIRVPAGNAAKLFSLTQTGDRVRIVP
jgi:ankyrin repeat protein